MPVIKQPDGQPGDEIDPAIVKRHWCSSRTLRTYTHADWQALHLVGVQEDVVSQLELRNCACGSTITICLLEKAWTLDGVTIDVVEFLLANRETLTSEECRRLEIMPVGEEMHFGGGAMPLAILRRIT